MPKRVLQDVVMTPASRITPKRVVRKSTAEKGSKNETNEPPVDVRMPSATRGGDDFRDGTGGKPTRFVIWGVAAAAVLFLFFVLLTFFSGTVVEVVPIQRNITVSGSFSAQKDAEEGELPFKLIVLGNSLSEEVAATGEKEFERKASGTIVIYNTYSSNTQKLIKRTRFETPDGKIYRIDKSVVVPGTTVQNGEIVPGSIEAVVYADIPGQKYNVGLTDFTIPGFKGDPRFDKFYARSKTLIENGFSGAVKFASPEDISVVENKLQNSLRETLLTQARAQVPGDFILYDGAVSFSFEILNNIESEISKDKLYVTEKGTLYGVLFNKREISKYLASNTIASYDGSDVSVRGLGNLEFVLNDKSGFRPTEDVAVKFTLSGSAVVVWGIDEVALARDLAGVSKDDSLNVIKETYPNIQKAVVTLRPFWKKFLPENSEDITIRKIEKI